MRAQKVMGRTSVVAGAGDTAAQDTAGSFRASSAVFAAVALLPIVAVGFGVVVFLGSGVRDVAIGAALAIAYFALGILMRHSSLRLQQAAFRNRTQALRAGYESIVGVLCAALDLRDSVSYGQSRRISEIASVVAWEMGLRKEQVREIEKAAILHDIGKIGVADAVLSKAGPLDPSEWAEMKRHPELGHAILTEIDILRDAADVIHSHHERFDGSGYPRGLKGELIPLGARIFAVADAYSAMRSHRPYRKAMPHQRAIDEIVRNSGSQFDPDVVRAFLHAEKRGLLDDDRRERYRGRTAGSEDPAHVTSPVAE